MTQRKFAAVFLHGNDQTAAFSQTEALSMTDAIFILLGALLWLLMALLVRGLDRLAPAQGERP